MCHGGVGGTWDTGRMKEQVKVAPLVLIEAGEPVLGERAAQRLREQAEAADPRTQTTILDTRTYAAGRIPVLTSPSLFGEPRVILARHAEKMTDGFLKDALAYSEDPAQDVVFIVVHEGGNRGKKLLDAMKKRGVVYSFPRVKRDSDKADLVRGEARAAHRQMTEGAVQALVDAVGQDLRELLAATNQLLSDVKGRITETSVHTFYEGRTEAGSFDVADAALAGDAGRALKLSRQAVQTGTSPVPIVAALAAKLRQIALAQVSGKVARGEIQMAPWQLKRAKQQARAWTGRGLGRAIEATAQADEEVKGGSKDPQFALERALVRVAEARRLTR